MREIKFRLWDKELGMDYSPKTGFGATDLNEQFAKCTEVVMQYTGLKDKNGKEIYEGDIVRILPNDDYDHMEDKRSEYADNEWKIIEVKFDTEFAGYGFDGETLFGMEYTYPLGHDDFVFEIIGNIYESPRFIKRD